MPPKFHILLVTLILLLTLLALSHLTPTLHTTSPNSIHILAANSTLGFGAIIAVSHARSPRRARLFWAANLTDIDIEIPEQPSWTEGDVAAFRAREGSTVSRGSVLAWMGHLEGLKWFLSTPHETALIIEDDTDFSLHIRRTQIPRMAAAMRGVLDATGGGYWGGQWDILYPGHCDDHVRPSAYTVWPSLLYADTSVPAHQVLHPDTQNFLYSLNVPENARLVHRAVYPFCTFAYAVTRASAARILREFSREKEGGMDAFDVQLLQACRDGWRCWQVSPEVFHHGAGGSEIQRADFSDHMVKEMSVNEELGNERATWNIQCGARARGLWENEGDGEKRKRMKEVVGTAVERGECVVDGLSEDKGWKGCEWGECGAQS